MGRTTGQSLLLAWLALTIGVPGNADAAERTCLTVTAGAFDVGQNGVEHPEVGFEVRFAPRTLGLLPGRFAIRPTMGAAGTGLGSFWTYVGFRHDEQVTRWVLTPGLAMTLYEEGKGLNLGGTLEFRSSVEAAYRIRGGLCMGIAFYHLSNASLYDMNPGSESLVLTMTTPLTRH